MNIFKNIKARHLGNRLKFNGRPFIGGICLHDTAGSGTHNDTLYLANPGDGRKVSVDYTVERNGDIYQLNPDVLNKCTWHAGRATKWTTGGRLFRNQGVTQVLIGIELNHKANASAMSPIWPAEQVRAVAELCSYLCDTYGLKKEQITTHAKIIQDGSRTDPRDFPFDQFWFSFNKRAAGPEDGETAGPGTQPKIYTVAANDTLWKIAKTFGLSVEALKSLNGINQASNLIHPGQKLVIRK